MNDVAGPDSYRAVPGVDEQRPVEVKADGRADQRAIGCLNSYLGSDGGRPVPVGDL